jgi:small subunit ribosomal protein S6
MTLLRLDASDKRGILCAVNKYSLIILAEAGLSSEAKDKLLEKLEKTIKALKGKFGKVTEMGKKQLAYRIKDQSEALFLELALELPPKSVIELDRKLAVDKEVVRHLLVRED